MTEKYQHAEAFMLMTYTADDGSGEEETIWNSRDDVAPSTIALPSGKTARHTDWSNDRRDPHHKPKIGTRIFVDLTPDRAQQLAEEYVTKNRDDPTTLHPYGNTPQEQTATLASIYLEIPGTPDLIEVDHTWQASATARADG